MSSPPTQAQADNGSFSDLSFLHESTEHDSFGALCQASFEQVKHFHDMRSKIEQATKVNKEHYRRRILNTNNKNDDLMISTHSCGDYHKMMRLDH